MLNVKGSWYNYELIDNNRLVVKKKTGKILYDQPIKDVTVVYYKVEKNNSGIIGFLFKDATQTTIENFTKKTEKDFKTIYDLICEKGTVNLMSYWTASFYNPNNKNDKTESNISNNPSQKNNDEKSFKELLKEIKNDFGQISKELKYDFAKEVTQTKCICQSCGKIYYYNELDESKESTKVIGALGQALVGNSLAAARISNNIKDLSQCPGCGSRKIKKIEEKYKVDKNGNYIEKLE